VEGEGCFHWVRERLCKSLRSRRWILELKSQRMSMLHLIPFHEFSEHMLAIRAGQRDVGRCLVKVDVCTFMKPIFDHLKCSS
jgi:hypothetical protein